MRKFWRVAGGMALMGAGVWLAYAKPYGAMTYRINAGGCGMVMDVLEPAGGTTKGSVVLLPGLAATKKIMAYLAQGFAERGLRVFVLDLPGHGRTPGPFTPARAEACSEALVKDLATHGAIQPEKTLLAGHSMGGAIAVRVAARVPVAGVIAISPAPMRLAHGATRDVLLFTDPPPLAAHGLVITGGWELPTMRGAAEDLTASGNGKLVVLPRATHVSLLFDPRTVQQEQQWAAQVLGLDGNATMPSLKPLLGSAIGLAGLLLIAGPFLREILAGGKKTGTAGKNTKAKDKKMPAEERVDDPQAQDSKIGAVRILAEVAIVSAIAVAILKLGNPLKWLGVFQADYLASFLLIVGIGLLALHWRMAREALRAKTGVLIAAGAAALLLHLLTTAWLDLTLSEAWLSAARWLRFPVLAAAILPFHFAEETLLGPIAARRGWKRLALGLALRATAWLVLLGGILYLHNGEVLLALLAPYLALLCLFQRLGEHVVRNATGSAAAAAVFGAILGSGFCLAAFPMG